MTRTVNGNVATYVCTSAGQVVDVLPGIYDSATYVSSLADIRNRFDSIAKNKNRFETELKAYHAERMSAGASVRKTAAAGTTPYAVPGSRTDNQTNLVALESTLAADAELNERERRPLIHSYLREKGAVTPDKMKTWLYREVLHADLDDPYLGFDQILSKTYPFDDHGS